PVRAGRPGVHDRPVPGRLGLSGRGAPAAGRRDPAPVSGGRAREAGTGPGAVRRGRPRLARARLCSPAGALFRPADPGDPGGVSVGAALRGGHRGGGHVSAAREAPSAEVVTLGPEAVPEVDDHWNATWGASLPHRTSLIAHNTVIS